MIPTSTVVPMVPVPVPWGPHRYSPYTVVGVPVRHRLGPVSTVRGTVVEIGIPRTRTGTTVSLTFFQIVALLPFVLPSTFSLRGRS